MSGVRESPAVQSWFKH